MKRFVLSNLIPEHTWLNQNIFYDGRHLLNHYMINIGEKGGLINLHGGYMQIIGA